MGQKWLLSISISMLLSSTIALAADFHGAVPSPLGKVNDSVGQLQIQFPGAVIKADAFQVRCNPQTAGQSAWAANDTLWTYNFLAKTNYSSPSLPGGATCTVTQTSDLKGVDGTVWTAGTLNYTVSVKGPNVTKVIPAQGFDGMLREKSPVIFVLFDGPVDAQAFFAKNSGYLSYTSGNAPAEKLQLTSVPNDSLQKLFAYINSGQYLETTPNDKNWLLATVNHNLIPGSHLNLNISNVTSAFDPNVISDQVYTTALTVRGSFKAEVQCGADARTPDRCLPQAPIVLSFNGHVKWNDVKGTTISYIPYGSTDSQVHVASAKKQDVKKASLMDSLSEIFPFLSQYNDTVVDSLTFDVTVKPETQAKITLDLGVKDIDDRTLSNASGEIALTFGALTEMIAMPQALSFFEKTATNHLSLPVAIVNLNQKVTIQKTGTDKDNWTPIRDIPTMINVIRKYDERGDSREYVDYKSPLEQLSIPTSYVKTALEGEKNRGMYLQFPFGKGDDGKVGGLYAIEVSSPSFEKLNAPENQFYNPRYSIAQVTDLSVHLKQGATQTLVWVTSLSKGTPVAGADVEIYNCNGRRIVGAQTDSRGRATLANQKWADSCEGQSQDQSGGNYNSPDQYFVAARAEGDVSLTHSSWSSSSDGPLFAPGVDYFYSEITENQPYYHSVVGVNLVKPGQKVPIQILVKNPQLKGFTELAVQKRAKTARVISKDDEKIYFDYPLTWHGSSASFEWQVPEAGSAKLGSYSIQLLGASQADYPTSVQSGGNIEVAEFKVPLMSGYLNLPTAALVRPDSIALNGLVRYANKTGVANLNVDISYYFEPTTVDIKKFPGFNFGNGVANVSQNQTQAAVSGLPNSDRPATIAGPLKTNSSGVVTTDIASQTLANGKTVAQSIKDAGTPQKLVTRLRYQDSMGEFQTLSQEKTVFNSQYYVGTKVQTVPNAKLQVAVVDVDGRDASAQANLEMTVFNIDTTVIGEELFGGLIKSDIRQSLTPTSWTANCTPQHNILSCDLGQLPAGNYAFQVKARAFNQASNTVFKIDTDGNLTSDAGGNDFYTRKQLPLSLNKALYKSGEVASISFTAPFKKCSALVTIERSDVVDSFVVDDACEKGSVKVPVEATYAPNAFVSIYAISGRAEQARSDVINLGDLDLGRPTYRLGYANLKVDWSKYSAKVDVATDKPVYKPGDEVTVTVKVAAEEGTLTNAKVSVVAIEEKILEIKPNASYDVLAALMQLRGDSVSTITPLERVESPSATQSADRALAAGAPGGRKGGNEGGDGGTALRRKFSDALVSFSADVPVVNGLAQVKFKAASNLTKFKVIAVANSESQKFGMGSAEYLSQQDTQAVGNFPNVSYAGDQFPLTVTVQNNGRVDQTYKTEVKVKFKDASGRVVNTKTFTVQQPVKKGSGSAAQVGQLSIPGNVAQLEITSDIYDAQGHRVDGTGPDVQTVLPTVPLQIHSSYLRQVDATNSLVQDMNKETGAIADKGEIRVTLASSLVTGALAQITDRLNNDKFADFFIESKIYKALEQSTEAHPEKLKSALAGLMVYLDSEGMVKYYTKAERGDAWLTAALINVLQTEPWAINQAPPAAVQAWKGAVSKVLSKSLPPQYVPGNSPMAWLSIQTQMGVAAFAFGDDELQDQARTFAQNTADQITANPAVFGQALDRWDNSALVNYLMLQTYANFDQAKTSLAYTTLTSATRLRYSGNSAVLEDRPNFFFGSFYADGTVETAQLLTALAKLNVNKQVSQSLATGLVNSSNSAWYSERSVAWVAQSLKGFESATGGSVTGSTAVVVAKENLNKTVNWTHAGSSGPVNTPWLNNSEKVQITHSGTGHPWVSIQGLTAVKLTAATGPLAIEKKLRNVSRDSQTYRAGDMVEVTLTINSPTPVSHIAILDPIPSGSNILSDAYGEYSSGERSYQGYRLYFADMSAGATVVKYTYQLNNPGTFNLPPTRAEGLYMPSVFGEFPNASMSVSAQQ